MAHVFEGQPDGRQADTAISVSRFRPKYRPLSNEERSLHDAIKDEAAVLESLFAKVKARPLQRSGDHVAGTVGYVDHQGTDFPDGVPADASAERRPGLSHGRTK